jgi:hypothetical protein
MIMSFIMRKEDGIMTYLRAFTSQELGPVTRTVDNDAPGAMRNELVDAIFQPIEQYAPTQAMHFYRVILQSIGRQAAGDPYGGPRYACGRDLTNAEWPRVYDVLTRLWPEVQKLGLQDPYRFNVNRILEQHQIVWSMDEKGFLRRVLPAPVASQVEEVFRELQTAWFAPALAHLVLARNAYDARPRNDFQACASSVDALESVAKTRLQMPTATLGAVLTECKRKAIIAPMIVASLEQLWALANNNFRHGMTVPFSLRGPEVDFVYTASLAGVLLFSRLP